MPNTSHPYHLGLQKDWMALRWRERSQDITNGFWTYHIWSRGVWQTWFVTLASVKEIGGHLWLPGKWLCGRNQGESEVVSWEEEEEDEEAGKLHPTALHNLNSFPKRQCLQGSVRGCLWRLSHRLRLTFCPTLFTQGHLPRLFLL